MSDTTGTPVDPAQGTDLPAHRPGRQPHDPLCPRVPIRLPDGTVRNRTDDPCLCALLASARKDGPVPMVVWPASEQDVDYAYDLLSQLGLDTANKVEAWVQQHTDLSTVGSSVSRLNATDLDQLITALESAINEPKET